MVSLYPDVEERKEELKDSPIDIRSIMNNPRVITRSSSDSMSHGDGIITENNGSLAHSSYAGDNQLNNSSRNPRLPIPGHENECLTPTDDLSGENHFGNSSRNPLLTIPGHENECLTPIDDLSSRTIEERTLSEPVHLNG